MSFHKYNQNNLCIPKYNHNYTIYRIYLNTNWPEFEFKLSETLSDEQGVSLQDSQIRKELFCLQCLLTQENVKRRTDFHVISIFYSQTKSITLFLSTPYSTRLDSVKVQLQN